MTRFLQICLGGAIGTGCRYLLSGWLLRALGPDFPYGTIAVNVVGSFLLGAVMTISFTTDSLSPATRLFLTTGVLGGFTTYSTFNYETLAYFEEGAVLLGLVNLCATVLLCLVAGAAGLFAGRFLAGG